LRTDLCYIFTVDIVRMEDMVKYQNGLRENGFSVIHDVYNKDEITGIIKCINEADQDKNTFRKSTDLFAIRQFLKEIPAAASFIFNKQLTHIIQEVFGKDYFVVKSIYFDKPGTSNWYVSYHQDLTISVDKKLILEGFGPWTVKQNQFAVQPPLNILQNICTIRIHLDDTDQDNGALRVVPGSHNNIHRPETIEHIEEKAVVCTVPKGSIMIMKPLLMHSSGRTTNERKRRVVHIEYSNMALPDPLQWSEKMEI
jgi:ectoine hydroxylase-related dioxygenase (phytanoyl-CoA dioxygenase family)